MRMVSAVFWGHGIVMMDRICSTLELQSFCIVAFVFMSVLLFNLNSDMMQQDTDEYNWRDWGDLPGRSYNHIICTYT